MTTLYNRVYPRYRTHTRAATVGKQFAGHFHTVKFAHYLFAAPIFTQLSHVDVVFTQSQLIRTALYIYSHTIRTVAAYSH